jgi:hypothetical protein
MRRALPAVVLLAAAACTDPEPCPMPLEECAGQCVDVRSDRRHCGGCGADCGAGLVCRASSCSPDPGTPCHLRSGGAFVTLGHCGQAVKLWIRDAAFVAAAQAPDPAFVASVAVAEGADCDAQWTWHVDALDAAFVPAASVDPAAACTVCPATIQADVASYVASPRTWCPIGASVLAVDARP